jgi:hypothetical protein
MAGIWEPCLKAVEDGKSEAEARAAVMKDPRVAARAKLLKPAYVTFKSAAVGSISINP